MKPGLYKDMPAEKYHRLPFAAQSSLKILRDQTPAHLRYRLDHPYEFETPAMRFGTLVHTAVLEPDRFDATHVRGIEGDGRKKEIKEAREELAKSGKTVVDPADFDLCMQIRDAVRNHRMARLLFDGESERSAIWKDAETGVLCKGRFDHVSEVSGVLVDLKTTTDASPAGFERSVYNFGYYIQAAHYMAGANALGMGLRHLVIIAAEKVPPYCVGVYRIEADAVAAGDEELRPLLRLYAECMESGNWPGYEDKVHPISMPDWAFRKMSERTVNYD